MTRNVTLIESVDHGTIVTLWVRDEKAKRDFPIHFDHRCFGHWFESHQACGRSPVVSYGAESGTVGVGPA